MIPAPKSDPGVLGKIMIDEQELVRGGEEGIHRTVQHPDLGQSAQSRPKEAVGDPTW